MKKVFKLRHEKTKPARLAEQARCDVRRYLKREKAKELPDKMDYWGFECRFGPTEEKAAVIHIADINKAIMDAETENVESFYVEILAKPIKRKKRVKPTTETAEEKPSPDK